MRGAGAALGVLLLFAGPVGADELLFEDNFRGSLKEGWLWIREHRTGWRATAQGLEVRVEPGNMWGPSNNASNVLIRPAPDPATGRFEISVTVSNQPTQQYEQADLVWFYDESHMVKLGQERVDGRLCIVMGREEADRTRTIAIIPIDAPAVRLRLVAAGESIQGQFRAADVTTWREAGACDLPRRGKPKVSLQFYQGRSPAEHWARVTEFRIIRLSE